MSAVKRALDVVAASVGLVLLFPLFTVVAVLIRIHDGGPAFFHQERVGRSGRPFHMWKFRTMVVDAERNGRQLTVGRDARITSLGGWLRKFKLDELPQLVNVLRGEMTLVGPRPEVARYVQLYSEDQRRVLDLRPGITDPASIRFRHESEILGRSTDPERTYIEQIMPEKIRLNLEYAKSATVWRDVRVVLATFVHVLKPHEARSRSASPRLRDAKPRNRAPR